MILNLSKIGFTQNWVSIRHTAAYSTGILRKLSKRWLLLSCVGVAVVIAACSGGGGAADGDFDAQVAAAVEATVAVAVRETVAAQTGVAAPAAVESNTNAEVAAAVGPGDNSHVIVDYLLANGRHFVGNPDADVVVIEFSDFQ